MRSFTCVSGLRATCCTDSPLSSGGLEDTMFQVERWLSRHVVRMQRNVAGSAANLDPANGAVMVPPCASHPDVAMLVMNPGAGVADGPVVGCAAQVIIGSKHRIPSSQRVPRDEAANTIR